MSQEAPIVPEAPAAPVAPAAPAAPAPEAPANPAAKPDSEKTIDELKAEAEAADGEYKAKRDGMSEEEIRQNYIRRRDKAIAKAADLAAGKNGDEPKSKDLDARDIFTLGKHDIAEDSEKATILKKYKDAGIIKSYADGLDHVGIKAEFDALDAKNNAKTVIDENDSPEARLKTEKEVVDGYRKTGEVPEDPKLQKAIADANLAEMTQVR